MLDIIFKGFKPLIAQHKIISIIGESSTGKTTLALQLIANLMSCNNSSNKEAIWIQASENFPKKRLIAMYQNKPGVVSSLLKRIYIIPKEKTFSNVSSQSNFFKNFKNLVLPPEVKYIVIDNISHLHRFARANIPELKEKMKFMNQFFNQELFPLLMLCLRKNYYLFLIHEVSCNPKSGKLRAYNNQLFKRVKGIEIYLSKSIYSNLKSMKISIQGISKQFTYEISDRGLIIL
ncbi:MAG: hypothetical protein P8Y23_13500 [Candidatus Lokiarchaeota archaeon]|jgi:RecA/RadA recombinase